MNRFRRFRQHIYRGDIDFSRSLFHSCDPIVDFFELLRYSFVDHALVGGIAGLSGNNDRFVQSQFLHRVHGGIRAVCQCGAHAVQLQGDLGFGIGDSARTGSDTWGKRVGAHLISGLQF